VKPGCGPPFGAGTNGFGLLISWAASSTVLVAASPSLSAPAWTPVSTDTLTADTSPFTDPQWTTHPARRAVKRGRGPVPASPQANR
jgi:hypothetical protein